MTSYLYNELAIVDVARYDVGHTKVIQNTDEWPYECNVFFVDSSDKVLKFDDITQVLNEQSEYYVAQFAQSCLCITVTPLRDPTFYGSYDNALMEEFDQNGVVEFMDDDLPKLIADARRALKDPPMNVPFGSASFLALFQVNEDHYYYDEDNDVDIYAEYLGEVDMMLLAKTVRKPDGSN